MVTVNVNSPHPLIKEPILYVVDPPAHLEWEHLTATFKGYGAIWLTRKDEIPSDPASRKTWGIRLSSIHYAEMALATLHGQPIESLDPSWTLVLSHSPTAEEDPDVVFDRPFPQYMKMEPNSRPRDGLNIRSAFRCFRTAGPLVSVRVNVDVGEPHHTIVIQYFKEEHANLARQRGSGLHRSLRQYTKSARGRFTLQSFDPCSLHCSGFGPDFVLKDLVDTFSQFGDISSATLKESGEPDVHGIVTFGSLTGAAEALQAMNGKVLETGTLAVRYADPEVRRIFYLPAPPAASPVHGVEDTTIPDPGVPPSPEQAAEAQENKLRTLRLRREELERLLSQTKTELEAARSDGHNASQEYDSAQQAQKLADEEVEIARKACAEAYRIWLEAKEREAATIRQASCAQDATGAALLRKQQADARIWEVEQLQESTLAQKAELDRELAEDDERRHQAELAESVRRMREMREMEEQERRERVRKEREAEEERQRRLKEIEERVEREKREQERLEAEKLEQARLKQEADAYRVKLRMEAFERHMREQREQAAALKKKKDEEGWLGWVQEKARELREREEKRQEEKLKKQREEVERIIREERERREKMRRAREEAQRFERELCEKELEKQKEEEEKQRVLRQEAERVAREQREEALKKQKAEEERQKRLREEAERVAREQRKKEEAERRAAEARQRLYDEALAKEIERCRERDDTKFCPTTHVVIWDEWRALARYMYIGSEFDRVQWSDARPLTFGSVPWPVLGHPENVNFETITWTAVERFFKSMERVLGRESSEYEVLVVKTQVRFHPDRWRARRVLGSVWDGEMRERLEEAGKVVAQAVTPLRARGSK